MADQIVQFEGAEHHFPADFTDADIQKALQAVSPSAAPGVPNPLQANPEKYTPAGLKLAPWGVPSSGPHKSFADTVGHDNPLGKAADMAAGVSEYLPSTESLIGAAAPGVAGPPGTGGSSGLIKRAISLGGGVATQWAVEKGLRAMGVPDSLARVISDAAGFGVASRGHGPKGERPIETTDLGTTSPAAKIPSIPKVNGPAASSTMEVPATIPTFSRSTAGLPAPAPASSPSSPATLDEIVQSLSKGKVKTFAKASPQDQQAALSTHNALSRTASKGATSPSPAPSISQPLGKVGATDSETNLVNTLRGNTTRKNLEIGQYFTGKGMTPEQVASMPEAQFNMHIRNVKNASGNAYQPSTGRNYHRTPEQARAEVVNAMRAMQPMPAPKPPVWPDEPYQPWPQQEPQLTAQ